jgi:RND family efflux transporter MFP subunit
MKKTSIIGLIFVILALFLGAKKYFSESPITPKFTTLKQGDLRSTIREKGSVKSSNYSKVFAKSSGIIKTVLVREGNIVSAGNSLLIFDTQSLRSKLQEAKLQHALQELKLNTLKHDLETKKPLAESGIIPSGDIQILHTKIDEATILEQIVSNNIKTIQNELENQSCQAPIHGKILSKYVESGESVSSGMLLFEIAGTGQLEVETQTNEIDAYHVKVGQAATVSSEGLQGKKIAGKISRIGSKINQENGAYTVKITIELSPLSSDISLIPGNQVQVEIITHEKKNVSYLPIQCVLYDENLSYVWVLEKEQKIKKWVKTGLETKDWIEIISGLNTSDKIIIK